MDFKNFNIFNFFKKNTPVEDPMKPSYIKPDGTKVIEQNTPFGKIVYEVCPNKTLLSRSYNPSGELFADYARRRNLEIGHRFDESGKVVYEFTSLYDEKNVLAKKTETSYEYLEDGTKSKEYIIVIPDEVKTEITYDKSGKQVEKIEYRGSVKTWFNENNKPIKREIDKGSGGIITENFEDS